MVANEFIKLKLKYKIKKTKEGIFLDINKLKMEFIKKNGNKNKEERY